MPTNINKHLIISQKLRDKADLLLEYAKTSDSFLLENRVRIQALLVEVAQLVEDIEVGE